MSELIFRRVKKDPLVEKIMAAAQDGYAAHGKQSGEQKKRSFAPSKIVYGSGRCPRYWHFAFNGSHFEFEDDPESIANMKNGTDSHSRLQSVFMRSGILTQKYDAEENVYRELKLSYDDPPIFGFLDLMFDIDGEQYPGEIKTSRSDIFDWRKTHKKGSDYHEAQLLLAMHILNKQKGFLIYEDKQSYELLVLPIEMTEENQQRVDYMLEWMRTVYKAYRDKKLPARGFNKNNKYCAECPVQAACLAADKGEKIPRLEI
jgi:CRISPR/Cas system-associated exonuclease Cas4 (RecB family)